MLHQTPIMLNKTGIILRLEPGNQQHEVDLKVLGALLALDRCLTLRSQLAPLFANLHVFGHVRMRDFRVDYSQKTVDYSQIILNSSASLLCS